MGQDSHSAFDRFGGVEAKVFAEALADELMPIAIHFEKVLTETMTAEEVKTLKTMLRKVFDRIEHL